MAHTTGSRRSSSPPSPCSRSEEHTSELQSHRDLHSFPTRRSSDLALDADTLIAVRAPVLLIHGAHDRLTPLELAAVPLLAQLPDARLYALARCGHVPALEHQQELLRVLTDFLESDA